MLQQELSRELPRRRVLVVCLLAVAVLPAPAIAQPALVTLGFDDSFASAETAGTILAPYGLRAAFYINSSFLGAPHRLTVAQVRSLAAAGHEIGGHTVDHANLAALPIAEARREVCNDRLRLERLGLSVTSFAYPYGLYSPAVEDVVRDCGYTNARRVGPDGLISPRALAGDPLLESSVPADRYATMSFGVSRSTTLADMLRAVDAAAARAQTSTGASPWLQLVLHRVCDASPATGCPIDGSSWVEDARTDYRITPTDLAALAAHLAAGVDAGRVAVVTPSDVFGAAARGLPYAAPVVPLRVPNGDAETPTGSSGRLIPCWLGEGATIARVAGAAGGAITMTTATAATGRLSSDRSDCPIEVPAGHRRVALAATVSGPAGPAALVVWARLPSRSWVVAARQALTIAATPARVSLPLAVLPADATATGVSLELTRPAAVVVDDITLTDLDAATRPLVAATAGPPGLLVTWGAPIDALGSATSTGDTVDHVELRLAGALLRSELGGEVRASIGPAQLVAPLTALAISAQDASGTVAGSTRTVLSASGLEATGSNGVAECLQRGGYGTYDLVGGAPGYRFERLTEPGRGSYERVSATGWRSGARSLITSQARPECFVPAGAGLRVRVDANVRATLAAAPDYAQLVVYARVAGSWVFVARAPFPVGVGWAPQRFVSPALPVGTTAASAGVQLVGNGTLDVDDLVAVGGVV